MTNTIRVKFHKLIHMTHKAILIRIEESEYWLPKKLCRQLDIHNKLDGTVCIPVFFAEKIGLNPNIYEKDIEIIHHIPEHISKDLTYEKNLFR